MTAGRAPDGVTATVHVRDLTTYARFIADVARAEAYFFALTKDEHEGLPPKVVRGIMALQQALHDLGSGDPSGSAPSRSRHDSPDI